ncbi:aldehyde dehydrogenase family protein [Xanthobacter sp. ZOL 2024]
MAHPSSHLLDFYIDGAWRAPASAERAALIDPATEAPIGTVALGDEQDVDAAVAAARAAFARFSTTPAAERVALLERIATLYEARLDDMAAAISQEMGAPKRIARRAQAAAGLAHLRQAAEALRGFDGEEQMGPTRVVREPIGVCALITPWNWPMNQIGCKVAPALAAGCTMVLKPSEEAPLSALLFAEILHEAGVPSGVFNLVNGTGAGVGAALSRHRDVDMVSFTGSNRGGVAVAQAAAESVKRVHQELGGKSPALILDDAPLDKAVSATLKGAFLNSGQNCDAPTRLLVPRARLAEAEAVARQTAEGLVVGPPGDDATVMGPVVNARQFAHIQALIADGLAAGARLVTGGPGRPEGLDLGFYVRPTVFSGVDNAMRIAREEIFGPVACLIPYDHEEEAIAIANDTAYGLSSYVWSADLDRARRVARRIRAGMVHINGAFSDFAAPFGGYKASGNGSEWGRYGLESYLEVKSIFGHG